ncbi:MAG: hypothetical protein ACI4RA_00435 [Kiritimatiellia bacterium]
MKKVIWAAFGAALAGVWAVRAETRHWTGAEDGRWANPNNWLEKSVPGRLVQENGTTSGQTGDVAVFGDDLAGNRVTTIDLSGIYSVSQVLTTGASQYTYGTGEDQCVPIEPFGVFSAAETSATPAAVIQARLRLGVELMATNWSDETMIVRNNSTKEFVLGAWGDGTKFAGSPGGGGDPVVQFEGSGDIRLSQPHQPSQAGRVVMFVAMTGRLVVDAETAVRYVVFQAIPGATEPQRVHITARGSLEPYSLYNWLEVKRATVMTGEGPFCFAAGVRNNAGGVATARIYAPITFLCPVACRFIGGDPPDDFPVRVRAESGSGTMTFAGGSTIAGVVHVNAAIALVSDSIGLRGTVGGVGDVDFILGRDATLRYTGPGETMDRAIALTSSTVGTAGSAALDHAGTGPFVVNSAITLEGARTEGRLSVRGATRAPATFSGTLDDRIAFVKLETGDWTFAPQNDYAGAVSVKGGALRVGRSLHLASLTADASPVALYVADGCTLTVDALATSGNGKVDVRLLGSAALRLVGGATGAAVPGVTLNGHSAVLDADLNLSPVVSDDILWAAPVSGVWGDAAKWTGGAAPGDDAAFPVYIDAPGPDYTVKIDGGEVTVTNLTLNNLGGGTATLLVTNGAALNVRGHTTSGAFLNMGKGGRLDVVDSTLRLMDQGNAKGHISNISSISLDGGEIHVRGGGRLITRGILASEMTEPVTGNLNTQFTFGTGEVVFDDAASLATEQENTKPPSVFCYAVTPTRAGEVARIAFRGHSSLAFPSSPWLLSLRGNSGRAVLEFDTDAEAEMTGWSCTQIGGDTGIG